MAERTDPYLNTRFRIEIDGLIAAGFSEVTGLQHETETEDYREGGVNDHVHKLPKISKQSTISLKRGITDSDTLWDWYKKTAAGNIERKSGCIILIDSEGNDQRRWEFEGAYPVKWAGTDLNAGNASVSIETLDLAHNGIK